MHNLLLLGSARRWRGKASPEGARGTGKPSASIWDLGLGAAALCSEGEGGPDSTLTRYDLGTGTKRNFSRL